MQCLAISVDKSELPTQAVIAFAWSSKKHVVLHCPDRRLCIFCWLIPDAFHGVLSSVGQTWSSTCLNYCLVLQKELFIIEDSLLIPPYTQQHLLWPKTQLWCDWWQFILLAPCSLPFYIIVQCPSNLDSSYCFIQAIILHDVLCI